MAQNGINKEDIRQAIVSADTSLGIEFGSTRIKAVLIGPEQTVISTASFEWENELVDGIFTYSLEDALFGLNSCYSSLKKDVAEQYGVIIKTLGAIGISGMMHGYIVLDKSGRQLAPFRTWRNTITGRAADKLTELFGFHIPQRWSIAHLEQSILNGEEHVADIDYLTTLSGYIHFRLTGERVVGVGEASGMFPVDSFTKGFNSRMLNLFDRLNADAGFKWRLEQILPNVLSAGENAGHLTEEGAKILDADGDLQPGIPLCPPEGDAGTGMVATNSILPRTGNVSAGTSIFAMIVLERELKDVYRQIDVVATPDGRPVAMVHCNNCTSDLDAWLKLFDEVLKTAGLSIEKSRLYDMFYRKALSADPDCKGLLSYNFYSAEPIAGVEEGRPMFVREPDARFNLSNMSRCLLFSAMASLKIGMELLKQKEDIVIDRLMGHGGLFKTMEVGQRLMASALGVPVSVMSSAGEGGAFGIAVLARYMMDKDSNEKLCDYLAKKVFANMEECCAQPNSVDAEGFAAFMGRYKNGLALQKTAAENLN